MTLIAQQIPLDLGHRPAQGRDDFLIAPSNQNAVAWIDRWPDWPTPVLIIYGAPASGKSHLAAVWGNQAQAVSIETTTLAETEADILANKGHHLVIDNVDLWLGDQHYQ